MNKSNPPIICLIVAMSQNRVIGVKNQLPWHLPADLKHFKKMTTGHFIIMGRKTYQSIGKPLPNRTNVVITRNKQFKPADGVIVKNDLQEAIDFAMQNEKEEIFIIGGAQIFTQCLKFVDRIYLTIIHHEFSGDCFFPELDKKKWKEIECLSHFADEINPYPYSFMVLEARSFFAID